MGKGLFVILAAFLLLFAGCTQQAPAAQEGTQPTVSPSTPPANAQEAAMPPANAQEGTDVPSAPEISDLPIETATVVMVAQNAQLGSILTDAKGMTLYVFTKDSIGKTNCYDTCAQLWPPFIADGKVEGQLPGTLETVERNDSSMQVSYNGMPLYYWKGDAIPGEINGQGYGGVWFVAQPENKGFPSDMSELEAREIASGTKECTDVGMLTSISMYNENSRTWWIDLNSTTQGCSPACVVSQDKSAEVNWRCTGLMQ